MGYEGHVINSNEIVIEIDEEVHNIYLDQSPDASAPMNPALYKTVKRTVVSGNGHLYFFPVHRAIRSRLVFKRFGTKFDLDKATRVIEGVPGERIHVDIARRVGRITDALFDPENEEILHEAQMVAAEMQMPFHLGPGLDKRGVLPQEVELKTDAALWSWIFWMRKAVDSGCAIKGPRQCRPIQNVDFLPTLEECVRSCKVPVIFNEDDGRVQEALAKRQKSDPDYREGEAVLTPSMFGMKPELAAV